MILPTAPDNFGVEKSFRKHRSGIEEAFGPRTEWALDPLADGYSEAGLRPLHQFARDEPVKKLAHYILAPAISDLEFERNPGRSLGNPMIEKRNAGLEGN